MAVQQDWAIEAAQAFAASANGKGLKVPIDAVAEVFRQISPTDIDLDGIERVYSTDEAACFFNKSTQWLYWAMKPKPVEPDDPPGGGLFYYPDGSPIEPERLGKKGIRRFSLDIIKDMGVSLYQHRTIKLPELEEIVRRIRLARLGQWEPDPERKSKGGSGRKTGGDQ